MDTGATRHLDIGKAMTEYPQDDLPPQPQQPSYGQQPAEPVQPSYQVVPMAPADQRTWAIASHLSPFLGLLAGGLMFLGPLIMYLVFKDRGQFVRHHAAETLNFQLTMWIGLIISVPLILVFLIGFVLMGAILLLMLVCHILGAVAASEGREYHYPFTIRFVS